MAASIILNFPVALLRDFRGRKTLYDALLYSFCKEVMKMQPANDEDLRRCAGIVQERWQISFANAEADFKRGASLCKVFPSRGTPSTSLFLNTYKSYMEGYKDDADWLQLVFYLALRSISTKRWKTTKAMIQARMFGYSTPAEAAECNIALHYFSKTKACRASQEPSDFDQSVIYLITHQRRFDRLRECVTKQFGVTFKEGLQRGITFNIRAKPLD